MVPVFAAVFLVTGVVGEYVVLDLLGLPEGSLFLMAGGLAGWAAEVGFDLVLLAVPVVGVVLARRALRAGAGRAAWAGLAVNALLALLVLYQFVDAIRMSYFAPLD
jgi:hypothetical protein